MFFGYNGIIRRMARKYFSLGISRYAAELSYFMLFTFCPILMFSTAILANINFSDQSIYNFTQFFPEIVQKIIKGYIDYLATQPIVQPIFFGAALTIYFLSRAVRSLLYAIHAIYDIENSKSTIHQWIMSLFFTCGFLLSLVAMLALMVFGRMALNFIRTWLPISENVLTGLENISLPVTVSIIFIFVLLVNLLMPGIKLRVSDVLPGTFFSLVAWLLISSAFSFYVNNIARYSLLYGSLGAIVILMIWLYLTSITLLLGPMLNNVIITRHEHL